MRMKKLIVLAVTNTENLKTLEYCMFSIKH